MRISTRSIEDIQVFPETNDVTAHLFNGTNLSWSKTERMVFDQLPPRIVHYTQNVENDNVHRFITEVQYDPDDYEYSLVGNYMIPYAPLDEPNPITITLDRGLVTGGEYALISKEKGFSNPRKKTIIDGSVKIWNATPGDTLYYRVMAADDTTLLQEGIISTTGQVRMIYAPSVNNIRDLGGWPVVGGGRIRYGRLYRGAKLHDADNLYLSREDSIRLRELNIMCEFDLRGGSEAGNGNTASYYSPLGRDIDYRITPHGMYSYYKAVAIYPEYFRYGWNMIRSHIFKGEPIFMHCSHGCDRAGTWSMFIEGVLGVSENDINLDYELSSFAPNSGLWRSRNEHQIIPNYVFNEAINYVKSLPGATLRDKFEYLWVEKCRIPKSDLDQLRQVMIEH